MPVQRTFFGLTIPVSSRMPPRRILFALSLIGAFAVFSLVFTVPSVTDRPNGASMTSGSTYFGKTDTASKKPFTGNTKFHIPKPKLPMPKIPKISLPGIHNPFGPPAHAPPVVANTTSGDDSWFPDWKWLHPFSSSITLDESRAVLPPLKKRPFIYTFYDTSLKRDPATKTAEHKLLLIWRRAWWAKGFHPVILGHPEAMKNPLYQTLQALQLNKRLEDDIARWLSWGLMGTGIFTDYLVLPMGPYDDPLLTYLRRGEYPKLTRYEGLGNVFFSGEKTAIDGALRMALDNPALNASSSFADAIPKSAFEVDSHHDSLAYYGMTIVAKKYKVIGEKMAKDETRAEGFSILPDLINSHLHNTFQNTFSDGIVVLKPIPEHTTALVGPALRIATLLAQCPESPIPSSCPPNRICKPCVSSRPLPVLTPQIFRNTSSVYTIGTVPHPYTFMTLTAPDENIDVRFIRRKTDRDPWIMSATKELLGTGIGGEPRLIKFKEAIAGEWGRYRSLWLTPEKDLPETLDWHFGFEMPTKEIPLPTATPPVPGVSSKASDAGAPTTEELAKEKERLKIAQGIVRSKFGHQQIIKAAAEAWNLADTEAWRFASAFRAQSEKERALWEEEERKFVGGKGD
ncbi:hypothetical protein GP486_006773 [Trichoglossum hirsutum]|uniref:Uncharacterized protein n=1 Tax=Trichoglossum hirsutum TaxID=265104 RepID=A0A9P8ID42_9PEZI|nr:hypothetical protein GP486_006773 [Trichoglossum hirsutum]